MCSKEVSNGVKIAPSFTDYENLEVQSPLPLVTQLKHDIQYRIKVMIMFLKIS